MLLQLVLFLTLSQPIGPQFHRLTSYSPKGYLGPVIWKRRPKVEFKFLKKIKLPRPEIPEITLKEALWSRRSRRRFYRAPISLKVLSGLLNAADGVSGEKWGTKLRTAPSAGALYPIFIYLFAERIEGLDQGLYVFLPEENSLGLLKPGSFRKQILRFSPQGDIMARAPLLLVLVSFFPKVTWKYLDRGYRYAYMEAGAISQNIYLACEAYGLSTVEIAAFYDTYVNSILGLDGENSAALALHPVGPRPEQ